jgi:hypothetical protein
MRNVSVPSNLLSIFDELLKPLQFGLALFCGQNLGLALGKGLFWLMWFALLGFGTDVESVQNHTLDPMSVFAHMYDRNHDYHDYHDYHDHNYK